MAWAQLCTDYEETCPALEVAKFIIEKHSGFKGLPCKSLVVTFNQHHTAGLTRSQGTSATSTAPTEASGLLEQLHVWRKFSPLLREGDCIIAEVGSAQYGTLELELPANVTFFTQLYYSCIGFSVGALLGALVAQREQGNNSRTWLFVGDGSLQMTVQVCGLSLYSLTYTVLCVVLVSLKLDESSS